MYQDNHDRYMANIFPEGAARRKKGLCSSCGKKPAKGSFRDARTRHWFLEYGTCQTCQDEQGVGPV